MKASLIATAIIIALFLCLGWQGRKNVARARSRYDRILAQAREQGLEPAADGSDATPRSGNAPGRTDSQAARALKAKQIARKLAVFGNDAEVLWNAGNSADRKASIEYAEGMAEAQGMDPVGLKLLVDEILAHSELNEITQRTLIFMLAMNVSDADASHGLGILTSVIDQLSLDATFTYNYQLLIGDILRARALKEPQEALDWLRQNLRDHPNAISERTKSTALTGLAQSDIKLAFASLGDLDMTQNAEAFQNIGCTVETTEAGYSALALLREYASHAASDEERQIALKNGFSGLLYSLTRDGYEASSRRLESANLSPEEISSLAGGMEAGTTGGDSGRWIEWMSGKIPDDQLQANVTRLVGDWTEQDYQAAGTWLSNAPDGPIKEAAVKSYASAVASEDPAAAAQWAGTLPAGDERAALMQKIYGEWKKRNADAAKKFAEVNGIGE